MYWVVKSILLGLIEEDMKILKKGGLVDYSRYELFSIFSKDCDLGEDRRSLPIHDLSSMNEIGTELENSVCRLFAIFQRTLEKGSFDCSC